MLNTIILLLLLLLLLVGGCYLTVKCIFLRFNEKSNEIFFLLKTSLFVPFLVFTKKNQHNEDAYARQLIIISAKINITFF